MKVMLNNVKELIITSGFGSIDSAHSTPHTGIDIQMNYGDPILSPVSGIAHVVDYGSKNIGKGVIVHFENGRELIFGHMSRVCVHDGQKITVAQKIGEAGSTGHSTGNHLHLGLKVDGNFADPLVYERMFQKIYATGGMLVDNTPHHITHFINNHAGLIEGVNYALQQLLN